MRFFTADTHFSHARIISLAERPFRDVQEMNEMLVANWNSVVSPDDEVWHLGDVALGDIEQSLRYVTRLNGTKRLIMGNHDRCFPGQKKSKGKTPQEWEKDYLDVGFETVNSVRGGYVGEQVEMDRWIVACHFPFMGDSHEEDRWADYRLVDKGFPILHGHTHSTEQVSHSPGGTLQINVGVEAWGYMPASEEQILALLKVT